MPPVRYHYRYRYRNGESFSMAGEFLKNVVAAAAVLAIVLVGAVAFVTLLPAFH
jgi:hypothetical protein